MKTLGQLLKFHEASIKQLEKTCNLIQRLNIKHLYVLVAVRNSKISL